MKVFVAFDHAGTELKGILIPFIEGLGHEVEDCAPSPSPGDDYPDAVTPCARKVVENPGSFGIIGGGSGEGEAMAANRVPGARAAVFYGPSGRQTDSDGASLSVLESARAHNDANILSLGARFLSEEEAKEAVEAFLAAPFKGEERHVRRIGKLG